MEDQRLRCTVPHRRCTRCALSHAVRPETGCQPSKTRRSSSSVTVRHSSLAVASGTAELPAHSRPLLLLVIGESMTATQVVAARGSAAVRIVRAGVVVAALDFLYVLVRWVWLAHALTVQQLAQSIAKGLLGDAAYAGGAPTAVLGLALHLLIACGWTTAFFVLTGQVTRLRVLVASMRGRVLAGLAWGPIVWLAMDFVVLPLSQARPVPTTSPTFYVNLVQHALMIGLPMSLLLGARR